jgi:hypothetical protein
MNYKVLEVSLPTSASDMAGKTLWEEEDTAKNYIIIVLLPKGCTNILKNSNTEEWELSPFGQMHLKKNSLSNITVWLLSTIYDLCQLGYTMKVIK